MLIGKTQSMGGSGPSLPTTMKKAQTLRKMVVSVRIIEQSESVRNAVMQDVLTAPRKEEYVGGMGRKSQLLAVEKDAPMEPSMEESVGGMGQL